eukprot:scaffold10157_cov47-Cyclotella_meneghiniana.AAC.2
MSDIPEEIILEYKLRDKVSKEGSIYIMAIRGMYGLPQSGLLANELRSSRTELPPNTIIKLKL